MRKRKVNKGISNSIIKLIFDSRIKHKMKFTQIANELNKRNIPTARHAERWTGKSVSNVYRAEKYRKIYNKKFHCDKIYRIRKDKKKMDNGYTQIKIPFSVEGIDTYALNLIFEGLDTNRYKPMGIARMLNAKNILYKNKKWRRKDVIYIYNNDEYKKIYNNQFKDTDAIILPPMTINAINRSNMPSLPSGPKPIFSETETVNVITKEDIKKELNINRFNKDFFMKIFHCSINDFNWKKYSNKLCKKYSDKFDQWWNPEKFDWDKSWTLCEYCSDKFDIWWNPDKFNWNDDSYYLCRYCSDKFDQWWNSDKFNWKYYEYLCKYCSNKFDQWWNPDKFNWGYSNYLCEYCSDKFDIWWNPDLFNWNDSWALCQYCSDKFNQWWNYEKFNWDYSWTLCEFYADKFNQWWNPEKFNWSNSWALCKYNSDKFDQWWNSDKFNWEDSNYLCRYCSDKFDQWWNHDMFNWKYSWGLCEYCSDKFDRWWNPDKFNWVDSLNLCEYYPNKFNEWFDPDKFNWKYSWGLCKYCSDNFDQWWNPDKFDWYGSYALCEYCSDKFNIWWNSDKFNWNKSEALCKYCSDKFNIWWNPDKFNLVNGRYLFKYCMKYYKIWWNPDKMTDELNKKIKIYIDNYDMHTNINRFVSDYKDLEYNKIRFIFELANDKENRSIYKIRKMIPNHIQTHILNKFISDTLSNDKYITSYQKELKEDMDTENDIIIDVFELSKRTIKPETIAEFINNKYDIKKIYSKFTRKDIINIITNNNLIDKYNQIRYDLNKNKNEYDEVYKKQTQENPTYTDKLRRLNV